MQELLRKSAMEQFGAIKDKKVSATELTQASLDRINSIDEKLGAFNSLTEQIALDTAKKVDEKVAAGEELPLLAGVPLALKDNMNLIGSKTTASSKILENFVSPYNATVTQKLLDNLIPIVGKANLDEFAMGSSNENSAFKKVHNPWNLNKVPGGSSGGSAAAVSACEATLALGSDTGGSIRLPASFCGIVGMKPTYGKVSRYGLIAFASSLDQIGPFARTVEDAAALLDFVQTLPQGINTIVGESGIKLSGGQKQRLAIARALLKNSSIILFDESTSSLDNLAQNQVKQSIENIKGKSTVVIVAHRLSTIKNVDKIFFLENGEIVDSGTFNELYKRNKNFKTIFLAENL